MSWFGGTGWCARLLGKRRLAIVRRDADLPTRGSAAPRGTPLRSRVAGATPVAAAAFGAAAAPAPGRRLRSRQPQRAVAGATRQHGEPAWHRRARRLRADARVLVRLDAARARLASHHSAPFAGMQRGRGGARVGNGQGGNFPGGGTAGGAVDARAAQQFLWSLFSGAVGGPQRGRPSQRRSAAGSQPRPGEWSCPCGFATNRPHRMACYACGRARGGTEAAGKGGEVKGGGKGGGVRASERGRLADRGATRGYVGPIGADGARPMLGQFGAARRGGLDQAVGAAAGPHVAGSPSAGATRDSGRGLTVGKGSWATVAAEGKGPSKGEKGGGGAWASATPRATMEEGGFTMVQRCRARGRGGSQADQLMGDNDVGAGDARGPQARQRWSDAASESDLDEDMGCDGGVGEWEEEEEARAAEAAEESPGQLRANFEELAKAVRNLERTGGFTQDGTAIRALREARDKAEAAWRSAKAPAPLPTRMAWAEAKLERAATALTKARLAIEQLDAEYDRQRGILCQQMEQADAWHKWRQQQLDDLHGEAAEKAPNRCQGRASEGETEVRDKIRSQLLPELQSIMEHAEGNPEILDKLSLLAAGLVDAESRLGERPSGAAAETFDMADGDSEGGNGNATARPVTGKGGTEVTRASATDDKGGGKGKTSEWRADGPGRWTRAAVATGARGVQTGSTLQATTAEPAPSAEGGPEAGGRGGAGGNASDADGHDQTGGSNEVLADCDGEHGKPPKHRRKGTDTENRCEAREESDRRRAEELRAQQDAVAAAQIQSFNSGAGGFGSEAALSLAAQKFVEEVQSAQRRAARMGVVPRAEDGRSLLQLTPMELQGWVEANLGEEDEY